VLTTTYSEVFGLKTRLPIHGRTPAVTIDVCWLMSILVLGNEVITALKLVEPMFPCPPCASLKEEICAYKGKKLKFMPVTCSGYARRGPIGMRADVLEALVVIQNVGS
jgi:hypothetical protein